MRTIKTLALIGAAVALTGLYAGPRDENGEGLSLLTNQSAQLVMIVGLVVCAVFGLTWAFLHRNRVVS